MKNPPTHCGQCLAELVHLKKPYHRDCPTCREKNRKKNQKVNDWKNYHKKPERQREYAKKNPEKIKEIKKRYYIKNREKRLIYAKNYYLKNRDKRIEYGNKYYRYHMKKMKKYLYEVQISFCKSIIAHCEEEAREILDSNLYDYIDDSHIEMILVNEGDIENDAKL